MIVQVKAVNSLDALTFRGDAKAALRAYHERGYHIEPNLLPPERCDMLIALAASFPNARDGIYRPIPMPHLEHPLFLDMMRYRPVVQIVEQIVRGKASGLGGEFFYMRPGTPGFSLHQDNAYIQAPRGAFCSAWTALCDVDETNGGLIFFPGSHKLGLLPTRASDHVVDPGQNPNARTLECVMPIGIEPMTVVVKKGSTVFFDSMLVHGSNSNTSEYFRYSFLATYIRLGQPFRPGRVQQRTEIDLYID